MCYGAHPCRAPPLFSSSVLGLTHVDAPPGLSSGFWLGSANVEPWKKLGGRGDSLWPVSALTGGHFSSHSGLLFVGFFQFPGKGSPPDPMARWGRLHHDDLQASISEASLYPAHTFTKSPQILTNKVVSTRKDPGKRSSEAGVGLVIDSRQPP